MEPLLLFINWEPNPVAFEIGSISIKWYGVSWMLAILSTYFLGVYVLRALNKTEEHLAILVQYLFIGGLIGARLGQVFFYEPMYFIRNPAEILYVWHGGLASHGGMIGGMITVFIFTRAYKQYSLFWLMDHIAICILFLSSFIRFGNLMNSELIGTATNVPWAFRFLLTDEIPRHPVVLYESIAYFILQIVMLLLFKKYKESRPGIYMATFFVAVFSIRFLLEFFKVPEGFQIWGLISKTQLLNIPFIVAGVVLFVLISKRILKYPELKNG
jgi:prolipoprotein diacylglyceryl transferase